MAESKPGRLKIYAAEAVISRRAQRTEQKRKQHGCGNGGDIATAITPSMAGVK